MNKMKLSHTEMERTEYDARSSKDVGLNGKYELQFEGRSRKVMSSRLALDKQKILGPSEL